MKYLISIVLLALSANVSAEIYPGVTFTTGCSMVNNNTGDTQYMFSHGALDYRTSGLLMATFQVSMLEFYKELMGDVDPSVRAQMDWVGKLEKSLAE